MKGAAAIPLLIGATAATAANLAPAAGVYGATLGAGAATAAERSAFGQNPAALKPSAMGLRLDFQRPYGLEDLAVAEAGIAVDGAKAGIACDWRATEIAGLYAEHGFRLAPAARVFRGPGFPGTLDVGYGIAAWRQSAAGSAPAWDFTHEAGFAWRPWPRLKAGAFATGLPQAPGRAASARILGAGLEACSRPPGPSGEEGATGQILRLDFRRTGGAPWRALASLTVRPFPGAEATVGAATPPFQAAIGIGIAWRGIRLRQAARYHRHLGRTWLSGADYGFRGIGKGT